VAPSPGLISRRSPIEVSAYTCTKYFRLVSGNTLFSCFYDVHDSTSSEICNLTKSAQQHPQWQTAGFVPLEDLERSVRVPEETPLDATRLVPKIEFGQITTSKGADETKRIGSHFRYGCGSVLAWELHRNIPQGQERLSLGIVANRFPLAFSQIVFAPGAFLQIAFFTPGIFTNTP
jgi:hypothetical protein